MKKKHPVRRGLRLVLVAYLLFALVAGLTPYALPPKTDAAEAARLSALDYTSDATGPDRALLVEDPYDALNVRIMLLREAQHTLDIAYHTVQYGDSTQAFFGEVVKAADRGVQVRLLIDGKAGALTFTAQNMLKAVAAHPNIEMRHYNPLNPLQPWEWNTLLHDKFIVADAEYLLLGGRNIGDTYFAPETYEKAVTNDRDVLVWRASPSLGGSVLPQAEEYMQLLWDSPDTKAAPALRDSKATPALEELRQHAAEFERLLPAYYTQSMEDYRGGTVETNRITLVHNPINTSAKQPWVGYALRGLMLSAEKSVIIQTPYATSNSYYLDMLADSAANAYTVLLTNSMASSPNYPAFSNYSAHRQKFLNTGVDIYEYQSADSIHGKSVVVDGAVAAVGSFNMDDRSLHIDTETMLVIHSEAFAGQLQSAMDDYMAESLMVGENGEYLPGSIEAIPVSWGKRFGMWLFSLISRPFRFLM